MIPAITERHFPSYATLHQATVSFEEMGERTISTQVKIDGDVVPEFGVWDSGVFYPMELEFRGETFILPTQKPQAAKDNSSRSSLIDLVFTSKAASDLKRYFFAEMSEVVAGTVMIDKYVASLRLPLTRFVQAFNTVLGYYFPDGSYVMNLNPSYVDSGEVKDFEIDYQYIWDVLTKMYEVYEVNWEIVTSAQTGVTTIRVGYTPETISSHVFEYGFNGGLLRFERHVEDTDIRNVLLGRGGEKNLPYRYFKGTDQYSPVWAADPDAIPELSKVFFPRLLDANFRRYVEGWRTNSRGQAGAVDTYDASRAATDWAYAKGHNDTKFDPVEYVKDDDSIEVYGVRQGKMDDDDDIFPTIQGVWLSGIGRADEVVDVDVVEEGSSAAVWDHVAQVQDFSTEVQRQDIRTGERVSAVASSNEFSVPEGRVGRMESAWLETPVQGASEVVGSINTTDSYVYVSLASANPNVRPANPIPTSRIPAGGPYRIVANIDLNPFAGVVRGNFGLENVSIHCTPSDGLSNREVFTIWVKNIWQTTQGQNESDLEYTHRVWDPILGDHLGNEAAVSFSDGFMSISSDYTFYITKWPEIDRTHSITTTNQQGGTITVPSEWKITLLRSDAEKETTGLYIPNTTTGGLPQPGDHIYFTGIDLPIQYVKWAEERLTEKKEAAIHDNAWTNPTWVVSLDKVRVHTLQDEDLGMLLADRLDTGVRVMISDPRFTDGNALTLGVRSLTFTWNEPSSDSPYIVPDIEMTLSEKIEVQQDYQKVKDQINQITNNYVDSAEVKSIVVKTRASGGDEGSGAVWLYGSVIGSVQE